jgi:uncharacterized protein involved in cysteine biosynthesis
MIPTIRSVSQLADPVFLGVVVRGLAWSFGCFVVLHGATLWMVHGLLALDGPLAWAVDLLASIGASLLAMWLFVPVAAAIATLYVDRVAAAVERRYYPDMPPAIGAPLMEQVLDAVMLGLRVLALAFVALVLALLIPGLGLILAWAVTAYAIGRGLFIAVAMRRMSRDQAEWIYRRNRSAVLGQGAILALLTWIPFVNLLLPVLGIASMVHVLDMIMTGDGARIPAER